MEDVHGALQGEKQIARMSEVHTFKGSELDNLKVLHEGSGDDKMLRVFRELRTQLFARAQGKNFSALVTSVQPQGGASYVATNLAAAIALDRTRSAVLVDCNFYAPSVDRLLSVEANLGLTDYLAVREMGIEFILYASGVRRLRVIPVGKHNQGATERLSSAKMQGFVAELETRYPDRYVIVDSPSVGDASADVRLLAELCDFVVLVVPYAQVTSAELQACIDIIGAHRVAGLVFNNV